MKNSKMSSYRQVLKEKAYRGSNDCDKDRKKKKDKNGDSKHSSHHHKSKKPNSPHRNHDGHKKSPLKSKIGYDNSDHHKNRKRREADINESYEELSRRKRKLESELRALDLEEAAEREAENKKSRRERSDARKKVPDRVCNNRSSSRSDNGDRRPPKKTDRVYRSSSKSDNDDRRPSKKLDREYRSSSRSDNDRKPSKKPDREYRSSSKSDNDRRPSKKPDREYRSLSKSDDDRRPSKKPNREYRSSTNSEDDRRPSKKPDREYRSSSKSDNDDRRPYKKLNREYRSSSRSDDDRRSSKNKAQNIVVKIEKDKSKGHTSRSSGDERNWGKSQEESRDIKKEKPNLAVSGKLAEETNTYNGVVIKYNEPTEARKPKRKWRLYPFKGDSDLPFIPIHRQSAYLFGRTRLIADIPIDHPSCSKQHAVLQYRLVPYKREDGTTGRRVRPYIIDLDSSNGTFVNNQRVEARCYVELVERDVIKFGYSSREYVILHEESKNEADDDDVLEAND